MPEPWACLIREVTWMTEVKCSVDSCTYWGKGNVCKADSILVKSSPAPGADQFFASEFAEELGGEGRKKKPADTSSETCCETFRPRGGCCGG